MYIKLASACEFAVVGAAMGELPTAHGPYLLREA
jgi:hypothetical protein